MNRADLDSRSSDKFVRALVFSATLALLLLALSASHSLLTRERIDLERLPGRHLYLPSSSSLRLLSLGQEVSVADLYWLRFIQYLGDPAAMKSGIPQAAAFADLITDLDPRYGYAYQAAGVALNAAGRLGESDAILEKGLSRVPQRWQIPFYLAFNHWYERHDLATGAELLERAAALEGAPSLVGQMVARLSSAAGRLDAAEAFFRETIETSGNPLTRSRAEERLVAVLVEKDLVILDEQIARYRLETGRLPESLGDLVGRFLTAVPVSPDGTSYRYDPDTGKVNPPEGKRLSRPIKTKPNRQP